MAKNNIKGKTSGDNIIISTLENSQRIGIVFQKSITEGEPYIIEKAITINGRLSNLNEGGVFTSNGATTSVSDEELAELNKNPEFQRWQKQGYIEVIKSSSKKDAEDIAEDMNDKDKSKRLTEDAFPDEETPQSEAEEQSKRGRKPKVSKSK